MSNAHMHALVLQARIVEGLWICARDDALAACRRGDLRREREASNAKCAAYLLDAPRRARTRVAEDTRSGSYASCTQLTHHVYVARARR